jgi:hypothetical protein
MGRDLQLGCVHAEKIKFLSAETLGSFGDGNHWSSEIW